MPITRIVDRASAVGAVFFPGLRALSHVAALRGDPRQASVCALGIKIFFSSSFTAMATPKKKKCKGGYLPQSSLKPWRHASVARALVARVLQKHPRLNSSWTAEGIRLHDYVNMGVAIAVNDGVVAAVIPNAHTASLAEIAAQRRDVAERARAGKLRPADIADATFTISNLGMHHVDQFSAIITPPQAAILAVGSIADRVVAVEGKPAVRAMMSLTLACDHRAVDGARAAMFLNDLASAVREPEKLS